MTRYLLTEIRRVYRAPQFVLFGMALPVVFLVLFRSLYGDEPVEGTTATAWLMVNMSVFGAMGSATSVGGRIAAERAVGWTRQLRLTPMSERAYLAAKAGTTLLVAVVSLLAVYAVGRFGEHVSMPLSRWAAVFGWTLAGLVPFIALGLFLGHAVSGETLGGLSGGLFTMLALLGGIWFPVDQMPDLMAHIAKVTPSYWLAEGGREALTGASIGLVGAGALAGWTAVFALGAAWAHRRTTPARV